MAEKITEKYDNIGLSGPTLGSLTITERGLEWRSSVGTTKIVQGKDITRAAWSVFGKWGHVRLFLRNGKSYRYDGFLRSQYDRIKEIFSANFNQDVVKEEPYSGGVNYGDLVFEDHTLVMKLDDKPVLELPLTNVSQCVLPGNIKNEVELQFVETDAADRDEDALVEVRFYIPPGEDEDEETGAEQFQKSVLERANVQSSTGDSLVSFTEDEGFFLYPRGRYAINLYSSSFRIHGAKYDHKMAYSDIIHFFLLERGDNRWAFVIGLTKPIRQGQQRYNYLVLQTHEGDGEVNVNLSEDEIKEQYDDKLEKSMTGPMHHLIAKTFKILSGKKVYHSQKFAAADNKARAVKCSLKANEGLLYPLDKAFMFIYKPTLYIPFKDVELVTFDRVGGGSGVTRNFDLKIEMKPLGGESIKEYVFANIDKAEHTRLAEYLKEKKSMKIKDERPISQAKIDRMLSDGEEEVGGAGGDDEDEEEDEDYKGEDSEGSGGSGGSGGESDDDSSSGAEMVDESDLEDMAGKKAKKTKSTQKAAAKEDKEEADGGAGDNEEEEGEEEEVKPVEKKPAPRKRKSKAAGEDGGPAKKKGKAAAAEEGEDGKKKRKKRKKKDPNAPKRALTSFIVFSNDQRSKVKEEIPGLKPTEIGKLLGERWKALDAEGKKVFEDKAKEDKERYQREKAEYDRKKREEGVLDSDEASGGLNESDEDQG